MTKMTKTTHSYRYPGLQPFEKKDAALFYGRERESRDLYAQVMVEKLVVLFAKSGMGKSSLLNAGLAPLLDKTNLLPLRIRLSNVAVPLEEQFLQELERDELDGAVALDATLRQNGAPLWEQIKAAQFTKNGAAAVPLFILDQFEEVFTLYTPAQRQRFAEELADLANGNPPDGYLERLRARIAAGERLDVPALEASPRCKFIFAIRSDLLHLLNALTPLIPDIMRSRFELLPFGREQAEEAITLPAMLRDPARTFASPPFRYDDAALDTLIRFLSKDGTEDVESFQLQILCQYIERLMMGEKGAPSNHPISQSPNQQRLVTPALFGGEEGLNNILRNFYTDQISALPAEKQLIAREIIEEQLITESGRRRSVAEDDLLHWRADHALLDDLEEMRLLRREPRLKTFYYEICHDTLVPPILEKYKERQAEEDRLAELERRRQEQAERDAQLAAERRKRARFFRFMLYSLTLAALAVAAMVYAFIQRNAAERDKRRAFANDIAYKSKIALRSGDRTSAFRLAGFAHRYVDKDNPNVLYALMEAAYYNDHTDTTHRLPWNYNLEGHSRAVICVAASPDGKRLTTGSEDNTAKVWDLTTGAELLTLAGHTKAVTCAAFSPDGKLLATGSDDNTAIIWDTGNGREIRQLKGHKESVRGVAFSPDGKLLATGSDDNTVKIWDAATGEEAAPPLTGHSESVCSVVFSPDGRWLATGAEDNTAKIWRPGSNVEIRTFTGHKDYVRSVAFSPDGKWLATGSDDKTARIWDVESGKTQMVFREHTNFIRSVAFSPDGKRLATGSEDNTAKIWDMETGTEMMSLVGHTDKVFGVAFIPAAPGDSTGSKTLATVSGDQTAKIWDLESRNEAIQLDGHEDFLSAVAFSPDGKKLATGSMDYTAKIWDLENGNAIRLEGHTDSIWGVAFSPDGKRLATASDDQTAKIWDVATGKVLMTLAGHSSWVNSVAFSPDGKKLATASSDNTAKIWNLSDGKAIMTLTGHGAQVNSVAFSPDGKKLATGSSDNSAKIWDVASGKDLMTLDGHEKWVNSVVFSPDGRRLATVSHDNTAKIWDVDDGEILLTLRGHSHWVLSVAFSPDGKRLATGAEDNTVKIWNAANGNLSMTLEGHANSVSGVVFSPDGKRLATASYDFTAKIWELDADAILQKIQRERRLATITQAQLDDWNLETLLDIQPENEERLRQTREPWQIIAFADLSMQNTSAAPDYARAALLYQYAAESGDQAVRKQIAFRLRDMEEQGVSHPDIARLRTLLQERGQ